MSKSTIEHAENFKKLDESMQAMVIYFAEGSNSFDNLSELTRFEGLLVRQHMDQHFQRLEDTEFESTFLNTLHFPDIIHEQKKVVDAHSKTFQWIFETPTSSQGPWSNFAKWLESSSGTYWIEGKAGSGKSTLMNFISHHKTTYDLLKSWAGQKELLIPLFFFWTAGSHLQKSVEGFLRSVLFQILAQNRDLIYLLRDNIVIPQLASLIWTEGRLRKCLALLALEITDSYCICLFVDGLDELDGDHRDFLQMIRDLTENSNIKCCFSSRPERPFKEFLSSYSLRLQDLTRDDIREYVEESLEQLAQVGSLSTAQAKWKENLKSRICENADGVFLWVNLVLKSQINGIRNDDSLDDLEKKLFSLPADVEELYLHLLNKVNKFYQKEAAKYLTTMYYLAIHNGDSPKPHILNFAVASFALTDDLRLSTQFKQKDIAPKCSYVYNRIIVTCLGLLETYDIGEEEYNNWPEGESFLARKAQKRRSSSNEVEWTRKGVRFLHRSIVDFLGPYGKGKDFIDRQKPFSPFTAPLLPAIHLARLDLTDWKADQSYVKYELIRFLRAARALRLGNDNERDWLIELFKYYDEVLSTLDRRYQGKNSSGYWFHHWFPNIAVRSVYLGTRCLDNDELRSHYLPTDLPSLATFLKLEWYLGQTWDISSTNAQNIHVMAVHCVLKCQLRYGILGPSVDTFFELDWTHLQFLVGLIQAGANPNAVISVRRTLTIWQTVMQYMYGQRFRLRGSPSCYDDSHCMSIIEAFLKAKAERHLVFWVKSWDFEFNAHKILHEFWFEIDTALLPLITSSPDSGTSLDGNQPSSTWKPIGHPRRPLRILFTNAVEGEVAMSNAQVEELYQILRTILDTSPQSPIHIKRDLQSQVMQCLGKMHEAFYPKDYNPEAWKYQSRRMEGDSDSGEEEADYDGVDDQGEEDEMGQDDKEEEDDDEMDDNEMDDDQDDSDQN